MALYLIFISLLYSVFLLFGCIEGTAYDNNCQTKILDNECHAGINAVDLTSPPANMCRQFNKISICLAKRCSKLIKVSVCDTDNAQLALNVHGETIVKAIYKAGASDDPVCKKILRSIEAMPKMQLEGSPTTHADKDSSTASLAGANGASTNSTNSVETHDESQATITPAIVPSTHSINQFVATKKTPEAISSGSGFVGISIAIASFFIFNYVII